MSRRQRRYHSPVQLCPVVVLQEVSVDSLQQQLRTFGIESREVRIFLWGGHVPPTQVTSTSAPRVVSPPLSLSPFRFFPILILCLPRLLSALSGLLALRLFQSSAGGGVFGFVLLIPPFPLLLCHRRSLPYFLCCHVPWPF